MKEPKRSEWPRRLPLLLALLPLSLLLLPSPPSPISPPTPLDIDHCYHHHHLLPSNNQRDKNPRVSVDPAAPPPRPVLLANASLWDGDGTITQTSYILLANGIVTSITQSTPPNLPENTIVINLHGRFVSPGLVDIHSHLGLDSWPHLNGNADINENSPSRTTPQLKSIDAFSPWDRALAIINSGGVTSSLILPGSRNLMGGEAFAVKLRIPHSNLSDHMLLNAGISDPSDGPVWRWMKMACGENPKDVDPSASAGPIFPSTRLGEAYLLRQLFDAAARLKRAQDDWCTNANAAVAQFGPAAAHRAIHSDFPSDIALESLVALLRGNVILNVHCYETYDLEMFIRLSHEFGFNISTFHHALEAWQVADLLASENIAAAIFPDHWGYKREAYDTSVHAPSVLHNKGVPVIFKSDHPVINAQQLMFEAAKAHHYGFPAATAIRAITSIPAERMGQDHRIGYLRPGYDADAVIWDRNPLEIGAHPLKVFIDGYPTFEHPEFARIFEFPVLLASSVPAPVAAIPPPADLNAPRRVAAWSCAIPNGPNTSYTLHNIGNIVSSESATPSPPDTRITIENGIITCVGSCETKGDLVDLARFWVTPGLVAAGVNLGFDEISQEADTKSGTLQLDVSSGKVPDVPPAKDSLQLGRDGSKMLDAAFKAGVTTAVSSLPFSGVAGGDVAVFRTGGTDPIDDLVPYDVPSRLFRVGLEGGNLIGGPFASFGGHLSIVRNYQLEHDSHRIVVETSSAANIRRLAANSHTQLVIIGASEAWKVATHLTHPNTTIVFRPPRCTPATWTNRDCRESSRVPSSYAILRDAGVRVGLSMPEDNFIRGLVWEAGWAVSDATTPSTSPSSSSTRHATALTDYEFAHEAISLVSWNIAHAYGFPTRTMITPGVAANLVVYDGVPGTLAATVRAVIDTTLVECNTSQA